MVNGAQADLVARLPNVTMELVTVSNESVVPGVTDELFDDALLVPVELTALTRTI